MGKGGGGSAPQVSTAYQTNLPEYAKPYVTNMLDATQRQLFNTSGGDITGFKPYTPYSSDPTQYFAGPASLQQSTYNEAGQMQTPGQFAPATGLAGMAGMGQLGTAQQAGMLGNLGMAGASAAAPAFGAGQQFTRGITDPSNMASYMSPYQQNVTDIAKMNAVREAQIAGQQANLGAARQGTYGGARQALAGAERERNLLSNLSNIQTQGSQSAYDRALAQQQFGANLGLQGIQTGLQGISTGMQGVGQGIGAQQAGYAGAGQAASTLGQLGGAQQQADLARMGFQNQLGGQQQQYQQGIINQAIQDYATQQQYPMMQLGFMSNMLRGLPMQATTTQQYQAQPSLSTQAISGLGTAAGAYKAFGFKEGGSVKGLAVGGMGSTTGMAQQSESAQGIKAQLMAMPADQVAQVAQTSPSETVRAMANEVLMEKRMQAQAERQAEQSIAQDQMPRGLASAPAPSMDAIGAATGGIVAFAGEEGSQVEEDTAYIERIKRMREQAGVTGSPIDPAAKALYEKRLAELPGRRESDTGLNMIDFFSRMNKPGSTLSAGIAAAGEAIPGISARRKEAAAEELAATSGLAGLTQNERAEMLGVSKDAMGLREKDLDRAKAERVAKIGARDRKDTLDKSTEIRLAKLIAPVSDGGLGLPNNVVTQDRARTEAINEQNAALPKLDLARQIATDKAVKDDRPLGNLRMQQRQYDPKDKEYQEIQNNMDAREKGIREGYIKPDLGDTKPAAPAPSNPDAPPGSVFVGTSGGKKVYQYPDGRKVIQQ